MFELKVYVLLKKNKSGTKSPTNKRLHTYGKSQVQIETQKLELFIEDCCDIEALYIETADPATKDAISALIDKKRLVQLLVKDMTNDWASLLGNWRTNLLPYIKQTI